MRWFLMLLIFIAGIYYLVNQRKQEKAKQETIQLAQKNELRALDEPQLPMTTQKPYLMKFSLQTIKTLRGLTQDSDEKVRFASVELLWELQDESAPAAIKYMFQNETEAPVKIELIDMLAKDKSKLSLALLSEALKDYDRDVRLHAVMAIGDFTSKESIQVLNITMQDYDEEVRLKSLEAVNRIRRDIEAHKEEQLREMQTKPLFRIE
jgi:HEAT repeat protein